MPIDDIAAELGCSRRSVFRRLRNLWKALGGHDRTHGLHRAAVKGMLDLD